MKHYLDIKLLFYQQTKQNIYLIAPLYQFCIKFLLWCGVSMSRNIFGENFFYQNDRWQCQSRKDLIAQFIFYFSSNLNIEVGGRWKIQFVWIILARIVVYQHQLTQSISLYLETQTLYCNAAD